MNGCVPDGNLPMGTGMQTPASRILYSIGDVERDTGIARETLRIWERRYGFPQPRRNGKGERLYPAEQVARLHLIIRLIDQGLRPGKVVAVTEEELAELASAHLEPLSSRGEEDTDRLIGWLLAGEPDRLETTLETGRESMGAAEWIEQMVAPLIRRLGERWAAGSIEIHIEHLATRLITRQLTLALSALPPSPREKGGLNFLLATLPAEGHSLGLLMLELLLTSEGVYCRNLGSSLPVSQIVLASEAAPVDIVALSFSGAYPSRRLLSDLEDVRRRLDPTIGIWIGGEGVARLKRVPDGVVRPAGVGGVAAELAVARQRGLRRTQG